MKHLLLITIMFLLMVTVIPADSTEITSINPDGSVYCDLGELTSAELGIIDLDLGISTDECLISTLDVTPLNACDDPEDCGKAIKDMCKLHALTPGTAVWDMAALTCNGTCSDGRMVTTICAIRKSPKPKKPKPTE